MLRALGSSRRCKRLVELSSGLQDTLVRLRAASSSADAKEGRGGGNGGNFSSGSGSSDKSTKYESTTPDRVAKILAHSFHMTPKDTAAALCRELSALDRIHLVLALQRSVSKEQLRQAETQYVDDLLKQVKLSDNKQHSKLTRQQIESAVMFQRSLQKFSSVSDVPPTWRQLTLVALASGLPFVAFGMLDNGIMLIAGEQIDSVFGAKLGLTMMASAGLGNLVADVVGVGATHTVQDWIKAMGVVKPPRLSMLQQQQPAVKAATILGAALGVAVGCLVGMTPLFFMEPGFFVSGGAAELAANTAAAFGGIADCTALDGAAQAADAAAAVAKGGGSAAASAGQAADAAQSAAASLVPSSSLSSSSAAGEEIATAAAATAAMSAAGVAAPEAATAADVAARVVAGTDSKPC